jgi:class 3 adenylate cyclase/predicted ATPase
MRCMKCGSDNREGRKFCSKCGLALVRPCPQCDASNEPGEDFCGECGAALVAVAGSPQAASTAPDIRVAPEQPAGDLLDGERKTVTALFADIKGSTELMADLDPEEARAIIDPALKLMIDAVNRYDGYVVQSTGDGIFALFGAPVAHEDHPQRALSAALRMLEELRRYSTKVVANGGVLIEARVGVNTGEVVVRSITTGAGQVEYTPIGHTTNLASRMQAAAPTGSIAVSENTRRLCEGYFVLKPLGIKKLKGVAEPVNVYEVTGLGPLRTRLQHSASRGLTKFVGRDGEIETMRAAADRAKSGHGQIVAAMAEPGVGKSRLFHEFKATSQAGWKVLETFSVSHGKNSAYLPVIDLLRNYFDIKVADDESKRREKVASKITVLDRSLEDTLPYLYSLLGIFGGNDPIAQMDGRIKKLRSLDAIKRIVMRESLNQPLMVIFEDLHWIDEHTQELLNLLANSIGTAKILLLVSYRPEYSHHWNGKTYYSQLHLDSLGDESTDEMLSALLGDGKDLIPLKRFIIERTDGIPFFTEEIVQALFEDGALQRNGVVKLTKSMSAVKVPATVQAVLISRIDRLPVEEKKLLQTLAVLGREFPLGFVQRVTLKPEDELESMLSRLQAGEFIYERPTTGDVEYTFKHALTQEVAYTALLVERRKLLHERAGLALESMFVERLEDHLEQLAHHFGHSDNIAKAVEYLGRAGQQAVQRSAHADAISRLTAAINLLQKLPDNPERIQRELLLQLSVGLASLAVKGWAGSEAECAFTRAQELCKQTGDPPQIFPVLWGLWVMRYVRGELRNAKEIAEQLQQRAQSASDTAGRLYGHVALEHTSHWMGALLRANEHLELAISFYNPVRDRALAFRYGGADAGVQCLSIAALNLWQLGYPDQALKRGNEALALAHDLSHPFTVAFAKSFVGVLRQLRREAGATQENADAVIALSAEHGLTDYLAFATSLRGCAIAEQGCNEEGIAQIQEGLTASRASGVELWRPYFLCQLAPAYMEMGRFDDGLGALIGALDAANEHEIRNYEAEALRLKGELLLKRNDSDIAEAQGCFERAIEIAPKQSSKSWELRATTSLARLFARQDHRVEARTMLADIYNWFTEGFDTADLKDATVLLEELAN